MSQFIEMFGDVEMNDKGWNQSLIKDVFTLSMGKTPSRSKSEYWISGENKWVSVGDMSNYDRFSSDTKEKISNAAVLDSGIKIVPKNTIIMSFKLSIGRTVITTEELYTNEAVMAFNNLDTRKFDIDFVQFLFSHMNWLKNSKQAVKGNTLNKEVIGNTSIIIPPKEIQKHFSSILLQADKSKFVIQKALVYLNDILSGELRKVA